MVYYDILSEKIFKELTENSRLPEAKIAKKLKCAPKTVKNRIKRLDVDYVLELDKKKLGLTNEYFIFIKLKSDIPRQEIQNYINKKDIIQFAALTKGDFDLFLYVLTKDNNEYDDFEFDLRLKFEEYIKNFNSTYVLKSYFGFFPISKEIILKSKEIHSPKKEILAILAENSRTSIKDIATKLKISSPLAKYHVDSILKSKYVKKSTVILKPKNSAIIFGFLQHTNLKDYNKIMKPHMKDWFKYLKNFVYQGRVVGNYDYFEMYSFKDLSVFFEGFEKDLEEVINKCFKKRIIAIVGPILKGKLNINPARSEKELAIPKI